MASVHASWLSRRSRIRLLWLVYKDTRTHTSPSCSYTQDGFSSFFSSSPSRCKACFDFFFLSSFQPFWQYFVMVCGFFEAQKVCVWLCVSNMLTSVGSVYCICLSPSIYFFSLLILKSRKSRSGCFRRSIRPYGLSAVTLVFSILAFSFMLVPNSPTPFLRIVAVFNANKRGKKKP